MQKTMILGLCAGLGGILWCQTAPAAKSSGPAKLPELTVRGASLQENHPTGVYGQPEWTQHRRFSTTRVYLQQAPMELGFEQWWRGRFKDGDSKHRIQEEMELGLPNRFQLDLYYTWSVDEEGIAHYDDFDTELRWAFADWGKIPLNPTLYAEWKFVDGGPDVYELKLLVGDNIGQWWHWGANAILEQETGGERAQEIAVSQATGYTILDQKLGIGLEWKYTEETVEGDRDNPERILLIGPNVQWRPTLPIHLDVVPLFGATDDAPDVEAYIVLGYDFGPVKKVAKAFKPASLKNE